MEVEKLRIDGEVYDVSFEREFDNIGCDCDHVAIVERDDDQTTIIACSCNSVAKETFGISS